MKKLKRVAAIHDISGFGKCSLTVALPIISAAGIECSVMPTAVLSTHTGGFTGFTYRDLTSDLAPIADHWKSLDIEFDALYSGFLGSFEQIDIVSNIFKAFKTKKNIIMVDPVMADNGQLYSVYSPEMAKGMANLCKNADIVVPNMTEASFMLDIPYQAGPYTPEYVLDISHKLADLGPNQVVLTGVFYQNGELGATSYDKATGAFTFYATDVIEGYYHGTGDVFGSALLSALLNGFTLPESAKAAVDFTYGCIKRTHSSGTDVRFGVDFEHGLAGFAKTLGVSDQ